MTSRTAGRRLGRLLPPRGLRRRLLFSHSIIAGLGLSSLAIVLSGALYLSQSTARLARTTAPTFDACATALNGLDRARTALRSWMLLGAAEFRTAREQAWREQVWPAVDELQAYAEKWSDPADTRQLDQVVAMLHECHEVQWWVEDVAHSAGNEPARLMLEQHAAPLSEELFRTLTALMSIRRAADGDAGGVSAVGLLADMRFRLTQAWGELNRCVSYGTPADIAAFGDHMDAAQRLVGQLTDHPAFESEGQRNLLAELRTSFSTLQTTSQMIIDRRSSHDWNAARYLLETRAQPIAHETELLLADLTGRRAAALRSHAASVGTMATVATLASLMLAITLCITATVIAERNSRRLVEPVAALARATREMAAGRMIDDLPVTSDDEMSALSRSFNEMRASLQAAERARDETTAELRARNAELLAARTELSSSNATLRTQCERLAEKHDDIEHFVNTVAHDLKSPLVTQTGYLDVLRKAVARADEADIELAISRIDRAAGRMRNAVDGLGQLCRIGRLTVTPRPFDLRALVESLVEGMHVRIDEAGATVELDLQGPTEVYADEDLLGQVLDNLLTNAIKYGTKTPDGSPAVIRVEYCRDGGDLLLSVRDNGPGIAEADHHRVFGVFERLDTSQEGSGIGLAGVKRLIELLDGRVWLESTPGAGACFQVAVPEAHRSGSEVDTRAAARVA